MPDIIRPLSDHIANQIAAGEVIQRPASAIKELLENAVDAGATDIQVHLRDAGKELIQVIDNGKGMSPADARMAFERHATSKISDIADLFTIRTMGFRGEALASIAAVAQVEMRTCPPDAPVGTRIVIEGTEVKVQEPTVTPQGTNLMLKNLFFNVPARRHFLKSNSTEMRHILDEFTRVAMAYPEVGFSLWHGDAAQMRLESGNLKTRIVGLLGGSAARNLVPVEEEADVLRIRGFIGKPEAAAKSRGSQFFFINNRFIRSPYLHHAVSTAYGPLIPKDAYPFYVLFLEIDPARVDVNVHPTKQEVKFEDDRLMYAYLQAAVKHALARYNISPSLDFSLNPEIQSLPSVQLPVTEKEEGETKSGYLYNTFTAPNQAHRIASSTEAQSWRDAYRGLTAPAPESLQGPEHNAALPPAQMTFSMKSSEASAPEEVSGTGGQPVLSVQGSLLVTTVKSGLLLVHLRRARERIWYERLEAQWAGGDTPAQRLLFPVSMELPPVDGALLAEVLPDLRRTGFDISPFGAGTFVIQGTPPGLPSGGEKDIIEEVVNNLKHNSAGSGGRGAQLLIALSKKLAYSDAPGTQEGLRTIIDELFACGQPEFTATGKKVFSILPKDELDGWLG